MFKYLIILFQNIQIINKIKAVIKSIFDYRLIFFAAIPFLIVQINA